MLATGIDITLYNPSASPDVCELIEKMDDLAGELRLTVRSARTGRNYQPPALESGVRFKSLPDR